MNTDLSDVLVAGAAFILVAGVVAIAVGWWQNNGQQPAFEIARRAKTIFIVVIFIVGAIVALIEYVRSNGLACLFSNCG